MFRPFAHEHCVGGPVHGQDHRQRRPRAQPQEHRRRASARQAHRHHRALGLGEVFARLRHHLRRGAAPLRRVAVGLRAPVPRADGQARHRLDRRAVAGDLDRAEVDPQEPALDRRHGHRGLRLPAPAVRAHRHRALLQLRPAHRLADGAADGRSRARAARGHALLACWRRWCATARASTKRSSSRCASRASCASTSTASCTISPSRSSSTRTRSTPSRSTSIAWRSSPTSASA